MADQNKNRGSSSDNMDRDDEMQRPLEGMGDEDELTSDTNTRSRTGGSSQNTGGSPSSSGSSSSQGGSRDGYGGSGMSDYGESTDKH